MTNLRTNEPVWILAGVVAYVILVAIVLAILA